MATQQDHVLRPSWLYSRADILARRCQVPNEPGVYAWFFKDIPPGVPTESCIRHDDLTLLYVGISPANRNGSSRKMNLRTRLRQHMNGNAEGSTLRLSLGCFLNEELSIRLQRVGSGTRMTFGTEGEKKLSAWMGTHAFVACEVHPRPWEREEELIKKLSLPLNLDQNKDHAFAEVLAAKRREARAAARLLPVAHHSGR